MAKEAFMSYDPWSNIQSRNGIPGDELISMLQKSVRRGLEENALAAAYEMYITSPQFHEKMWRRLLAISVEDVGFGDTHAPPAGLHPFQDGTGVPLLRR